ncbi:hypothetical protein J2R76_003908 [Bradyrhizobium sp. USDA 4532]|nr:hypothetical protein [Bradyrhizobium sp. USDA 4545]MCP1920317.1 hypothetical protein [Bradyrhizobium sp. USDA 4532]
MRSIGIKTLIVWSFRKLREAGTQYACFLDICSAGGA